MPDGLLALVPVPWARLVLGAGCLALLGLVACEPEAGTAGDAPPVQIAEGEITEPDFSGTQVEQRFLDEIEALVSDGRVQGAMAYIEDLEERSRDDLIYLTEIPAPPFMEEERAAAYAEMLREAGADSVWLDEIGNVLALRRGTEGTRTVALDGHLDTVFPPETDVTVQFRGDTLYAPGIGDDTRGLIVVRNVLEAMVHADLRTRDDLLFIGTVGEEGLGDLRGVKHLFSEAGPGIDVFVAVDGGDETRVVHQGVGSHRYRVTFQGPGGHSWGAFGLVNPHHASAQAIRHFVEGADAFTRSGPRTSFNIGRTGGGTSVNSIPFESWFEVDMRSVDPEALQEIDAIFQDAMQRGLEEQNALRRRGEPLTVDVEMVGDRPAGILDPTMDLIQRAMATITLQGREPALGGGSTNANIPISEGIPSITIGRGGHGGGAHSLDEWWLNVDGHLAVQNAFLILLAEAGLADPGVADD